jgi:hypothetical protein
LAPFSSIPCVGFARPMLDKQCVLSLKEKFQGRKLKKIKTKTKNNFPAR